MRGERARAYLISAAVLAAVLAPLARPVDRDSFPLSRYPMYATNRAAEMSLLTAVAIDGDRGGGDVTRLSSTVIADTRDPLIAVARLRRAITAGGAQLAELCDSIAERSGLAPGTAIEIRTERHDAVARVDDRESLLSVTVHDRCAVA